MKEKNFKKETVSLKSEYNYVMVGVSDESLIPQEMANICSST